jgi:hypothetical protein
MWYEQFSHILIQCLFLQIVDESNIFHLKFETRLQAQRALRKHGHIFGQIMIGVRYCTDKVYNQLFYYIIYHYI